MPALRIRQLDIKEDLPRADHVLVVKLAPGRFEVSATAGTGPSASYLPATAYTNQYDALAKAEDFARMHRIKCVFVKGFRPQPKAA
jgi:hypothetical protein